MSRFSSPDFDAQARMNLTDMLNYEAHDSKMRVRHGYILGAIVQFSICSVKRSVAYFDLLKW